jgi:hypothetical protein
VLILPLVTVNLDGKCTDGKPAHIHENDAAVCCGAIIAD